MLSSKEQTSVHASVGMSLSEKVKEDRIQAAEDDGEKHGQGLPTTVMENGAETRSDEDYDGYLSGWRLQVLNLAYVQSHLSPIAGVREIITSPACALICSYQVLNRQSSVHPWFPSRILCTISTLAVG